MHLGRFHSVIYDLVQHFSSSQLLEKLSNAISSVNSYAASRTEATAVEFRLRLDEFYKAAEVKDPDLLQPYAVQVIEELELDHYLAPALSKEVESIFAVNGFDSNAIVGALSKIHEELTTKINHLKNIDRGFTAFNVEFQRVEGGEAEVGFLLPREVVGDSLKDLSAEFGKIGKLAQAINELTGAPDYEPRVITISSSWWQVFLDLTPDQITIWVLAIERIVGLFKSNLEIKNLQDQLKSKKVDPAITELIEKHVQDELKKGVDKIAEEIRALHSKVDDAGRANELENQLRQGLVHLANRISQGAEVEINVGVPNDPEEPPEGNGLDPAVAAEIESTKQRIAKLREARQAARIASAQTVHLEVSQAPLLISDATGENDTSHPGGSATR